MKKLINSFIIKQAKKKGSENHMVLGLQFIFGITSAIATFYITRSLSVPDAIAKIIAIILSIYPVLGWSTRILCQKIVKKIGIPAYRDHLGFYFATKHKMLPSEEGTIDVYNAHHNHSRFKLAEDRQQVHAVSTIEFNVHIGSIRQETPKVKLIRNYSQFLKNTNTIQLILEDGNIIGFTQIIPVTSEVWHKYSNGEISFKDISDIHVADDESYVGLIISTVACVCKKSSAEKYNLLYEGLLYHIQLFLKGKESLRVMLPICDSRFVQPLINIGFKKNENRGKDNTPIYLAQLQNKMDKLNDTDNTLSKQMFTLKNDTEKRA